MKLGQIIPVLVLALALSACGGAAAAPVASQMEPAQPNAAPEAPANCPLAERLRFRPLGRPAPCRGQRG